MSKTNIILVSVIVLIVAGLGVGGFLLINSKKTSKQSVGETIGNIVPSFLEKAGPDKEYQDEAGFSFFYPEGAKVEDVTPEDDDSYYSLLELSYKGSEIKITVTDTLFKKTDEWAKASSSPKGLELVGATSLGKVPANQYKLAGVLYTVAIDQGVIYVIEGPKDGGFVEETQNVVVSSFTFADQPKTQTGNSNSNIVYEEEEVVE